MTEKYNPMDLGLDLARARQLPVCEACRKQSDGCIKMNDGTLLCGTHCDEWLARGKFGARPTPAAFAKELREGRYKPCWDAKLDNMDR